MTKEKIKPEVGDEKESTEVKEQYHFSGSGEYEPLTIEATSLPEATEIWEKEKKKIAQ